MTFRHNCPVCSHLHVGEGRTDADTGQISLPDPVRVTCPGCGARLEWGLNALSDWTGWEANWPYLKVVRLPPHGRRG